MKATELRIGNYVNNKERLDVVTCLEYVTFEDITNVRGQYYEVFIPEPIPLTEEWLLKFGFESDEIEWWNGILSIGICKEGLRYLPTEKINFRVGIVLQYVHQLQNLYFALTNEELTNEELTLIK
jgi:hypothetical protein